MDLHRIILGCCIAGFFCGSLSAEPVLNASMGEDQLAVTVDGALFTVYKFSTQQKYPYFFPVNGPVSGKSITTETSEPYPHHHSLFFGCDRVNGGNYWQEGNERGQILSDKIELIQAEGDRIEFRQECVWSRPGAPSPFRDSRTVVIQAPTATVRILDFTLTLHPQMDVTILNTNHSLFAARITPELSIPQGGTMISSRGQAGEKATAGQLAEWIDFGGLRAGVFEGLAIMDSPQNPWHPSPWFSRDYGFFSPTPFNWLKEGKLELKKGEDLTLRYRVVVHAGSAKQADIEGWYQSWIPKND
ncbi:MAG: PmoA family protein [bacterium]|jgi:hypothetical protein|nr:PmoA family protein [bacterium]